jgi:hypothetical protein
MLSVRRLNGGPVQSPSRYPEADPDQVQMCRHPQHMYSFQGDAGILVSIGLLRNISWTAMEECILSQYGSGTFHP